MEELTRKRDVGNQRDGQEKTKMEMERKKTNRGSEKGGKKRGSKREGKSKTEREGDGHNWIYFRKVRVSNEGRGEKGKVGMKERDRKWERERGRRRGREEEGEREEGL